jgi:hypothetical protein
LLDNPEFDPLENVLIFQLKTTASQRLASCSHELHT